jgi:two-component system cell cycle sensor histidine kinase/response regulator CckA
LLVEDNPGDVDLVKERLSSVPEYAFELTCVSHLSEAVDVLRSSHIDAVLLDLSLPDSKGIETVRRVREASEDVAIVVLSGHATEELRRLALREGAQDFIGKDEPPATLLARIMPSALERHRALEHHRQIEKLVSATPDAVLVTDTLGVVQFANKAALDLFAKSPETLVGQPLQFPIREGEVSQIELGDAADRRFAEMRVSHCNWEKGPAFLVSIRDMTEQAKLNERLAQAQKMEALGLLAGGIAHDFNNLSLAILFNAEFLRNQFEEGDKVKEVLDEIVLAVEQATSLTRQLLAFSRRQPIAPRLLDLSHAVEGVLVILKRTLPENVLLEMRIAPDLWQVSADSSQMEQLVMNLAINARDAMPEGGRLLIGLHNHVQERPDAALAAGEYVALTVGDTGSGIAPELIERIFEPFFTTKETGRGSGLGLATCYGIVQRAQGDISVVSEVGSGSTFTVLLPRARGLAVTGVVGDSEPQAARGSATILLVEDNVPVRKSLLRTLEERGYLVLTAANGEEAIEFVEANGESIDLVVSDVVMPRLNGYELSDILAERRPDLKMLLMTGYSDSVPRAGAGRITRSVIMKPCYPLDLLKLIEQTLAS